MCLLCPNFRDKTPTYDADNPDKMIYVLFDRQYSEDDILIFVRPNTTELVLKFIIRNVVLHVFISGLSVYLSVCPSVCLKYM